MCINICLVGVSRHSRGKWELLGVVAKAAVCCTSATDWFQEGTYATIFVFKGNFVAVDHRGSSTLPHWVGAQLKESRIAAYFPTDTSSYESMVSDGMCHRKHIEEMREVVKGNEYFCSRNVLRVSTNKTHG